MKIYYKNNNGQIIDLMTWPYRLYGADVLDYAWDCDSIDTSSGSKVTRFYRKLKDKKLQLTIAATSEVVYEKAIDDFCDITEFDVLMQKPGRLYVNDYYMACYMTASTKKDWESCRDSLDAEILVKTENPVWISEQEAVIEGESSTSEIHHRYPYGYPYGYAFYLFKRDIKNDSPVSAHFIMRIFGTCANPRVSIAGNVYTVNATVIEGQYLEIDSMHQTVYLVDEYGGKTNLFAFRGDAVFQKIPPGRSSLSADGSYRVEVTILYERSEPRWKTS